MSKILLLAVLVSLTGCLHARHSEFVIPARCVRVSVQSSTRPCTQLLDGKIVCDGVVITAQLRGAAGAWTNRPVKSKAPSLRGRIGAVAISPGPV